MRLPLLIALALPALLRAQDAPTFAARAEVVAPLQNLNDAVNGKPGAGLALHAEFPLEGSWAWRAELGYDRFPKGPTAGSLGLRTEADVSHVSVEGIYHLRLDSGPYLLFGLGGYSWGIRSSDATLGFTTTRRVAHVGASLGFGYRMNSHLDIELRGAEGRVDPDFTAAWAGVSASWRF